MPSLFPDLFTYSFIAIFALRALVGLIFLSFAYQTYKYERAQYKTFFHRFSKKGASWFLWFAFAVELIIGTSLFVGYYTQLSALIGGILLFVAFFIKKKLPALLPYSTPSFYFMFCILTFSFLFLGPGAFAFDYPL